jgi:glucosyl-3-phosphoglycerate synthase
MESGMRDEVRHWFDRRTWHHASWPVELLVELKQSAAQPPRISVVLPARNEQDTVGDVITAVRSALVDNVALVDELLVMDNGSTDATAARAASAGARVVASRNVQPHLGDRPGKGEALWKSLFVTSGDLLVFVDADLVDVSAHFVTGLLGPLLADPEIGLVKAFYDRPLVTTDGVHPQGGGRVTEIAARPLLNLYWPALAGLIQPLSGEYAARRSLLERIPFACGYGVEIAMLIDVLALYGLDSIAQVDLGLRVHRHQSDVALGLMAAEIQATALRRAPTLLRDASLELTRFRRDGDGDSYTWDSLPIPGDERPPAVRIAEYALRRADENEAPT